MYNIVNTKNLTNEEKEIISNLIRKYNNKNSKITDNFNNSNKNTIKGQNENLINTKINTEFNSSSHNNYCFSTVEPFIRNTRNEKSIYNGILENQREFAWQQLLNKNTNYLEVISTYKSKSSTFKGCLIRFFKYKIFPCCKYRLKISSHKERIKRQTYIDFDSIIQIHRDIQRTYVNHPLYSEKYGRGQKHLFQFLINFSIKYPEIGYCQGLSSICAVLLMYFNIRQAEVFFDHYILRNNLISLYDKKLSKLNFILEIEEKFLKKLLKNKYKKVANLTQIYTSRWYLSLFTSFPLNFTERIFDLVFYFGFPILILVSASIFKLYDIDDLKEDEIEIDKVMNQVKAYAKRKILFDLYDDFFN